MWRLHQHPTAYEQNCLHTAAHSPGEHTAVPPVWVAGPVQAQRATTVVIQLPTRAQDAQHLSGIVSPVVHSQALTGAASRQQCNAVTCSPTGKAAARHLSAVHCTAAQSNAL